MNTRYVPTLALLAVAWNTSIAAEDPQGTAAARSLHIDEKQVWAISTDNDLFVPSRTDRDFTAGAALTYSGRAGLHNWHYFDSGLGAIDRWTGLAHRAYSEDDITPSIEFGVYGFTPSEISEQALLENDRPYASLVYLSASRVYRPQFGDDAWTSTLTVGALGLDTFKAAQNTIHRMIDSPRARGWRHQVSDGGEATFRYQAAYHDFWGSSSASAQYKTTYFGSVGYLTEAGIAITSRRGLISSPDYRFNPELTDYGEGSNLATLTPYAGNESYFWGGVALKARLYNAFLQGQFRSSDYTLGGSDLRPILAEAWIGYTLSLARDFKFSYVMRAQTSEIKDGKANRDLLWGGLALSKTY